MMQEIIGIAGLILLALSWIPQVVHTVKTRQGISLRFGFAQLTGSLFLVLYSYMVNNLLFIIVNAMVVLLVSINLRYSFRVRKK